MWNVTLPATQYLNIREKKEYDDVMSFIRKCVEKEEVLLWIIYSIHVHQNGLNSHIIICDISIENLFFRSMFSWIIVKKPVEFFLYFLFPEKLKKKLFWLLTRYLRTSISLVANKVYWSLFNTYQEEIGNELNRIMILKICSHDIV